MHTVTRQFTIRYFLLMQSVKGQTFVAIFYRISAWLHWFSSGFTGIEIFTYIQVCDVPAKLINNWASEASPTLGCSIEISRDIYMFICRYVSYVKLTA